MGVLKGGVVVGVAGLDPEDDQPTTFYVRDVEGEVHELVLEISRMGTYAWFARPPFEIPQEGDYGDEPEAAAEGETEGEEGGKGKSDEEKLKAVPQASQRKKKRRRSVSISRDGGGARSRTASV